MPNSTDPIRPLMGSYSNPGDFLCAMIQYRKAAERGFSVAKACKDLRRTSPTLISLISKKKRKITLDRADELSTLMHLTPSEKSFFKQWLGERAGLSQAPAPEMRLAKISQKVSTHILRHWLNVYVKDCFQITAIQQKPELLFEHLRGISTRRQIEKSLQFLLHEGYLRRDPNGSILPEVHLTVTDPQISSQKIRQFHRAALKIARDAIELHPPQERMANTLLMSLGASDYARFLELVQEFAKKVQEFSTQRDEGGDRLYQFVLNLSPTGRKFD